MNNSRHPSSFKDPSGFVFIQNGILYRRVNRSYATHYDLLRTSGLYKHLVEKNWLIDHIEHQPGSGDSEHYLTLEPEFISFISYPYEWCFDQLRDAALLTLSVLKASVNYGMIIKDATPLNVQFRSGKPVFIDSLSFEKYDPSVPWIAYRQFCETFLFPLYLEHYLSVDFQKFYVGYKDGIPVDVIAKLLPFRSKLNLGIWLHVYLQNMVRKTSAGKKQAGSFSKQKLLNLVTHLENIIRKLKPNKTSVTNWNNYYNQTITGDAYLQKKDIIFREFLTEINPLSALDIGTNDGYFAKILAEKKIDTIAIDTEAPCINSLYRYSRNGSSIPILPLVIDITNPSSASGFGNNENYSFNRRIAADLVIALALIHHVVIGKNVPLQMVASYFAELAPLLIIEFVPKEDDKVIHMLTTREDIFFDYTPENFEKQFHHHFYILKKSVVPGTTRILYLMERKKINN